eukprot:403370443
MIKESTIFKEEHEVDEDEKSSLYANTSNKYFKTKQKENPLVQNKGRLSQKLVFDKAGGSPKKGHYFSMGNLQSVYQSNGTFNLIKKQEQTEKCMKLPQPTLSMHVKFELEEDSPFQQNKKKLQDELNNFYCQEQMEQKPSYNNGIREFINHYSEANPQNQYQQIYNTIKNEEFKNSIQMDLLQPQARQSQKPLNLPYKMVQPKQNKKKSRSRSRQSRNNQEKSQDKIIRDNTLLMPENSPIFKSSKSDNKKQGSKTPVSAKLRKQGTPKFYGRNQTPSKRNISQFHHQDSLMQSQQDQAMNPFQLNFLRTKNLNFQGQSQRLGHSLRKSVTANAKDQVFDEEQIVTSNQKSSKKMSKEKLMRVISKDFLGYDREEEEENQNSIIAFKQMQSSNLGTQIIGQQQKISDKEMLKTTMTLLDMNMNQAFQQLDYVENFFQDQSQFELYINDLQHTKCIISQVERFSLVKYRDVKKRFRKFSTKRKTLVFDLDETLIRSEFRLKEGFDKKFTLQSRYSWTGRSSVFLFFRPFLMKMLKSLQADFEIVIFTASQEDYASKILRCIDKEQCIFDHLLHRDQCLQNEKHKVIVKDLGVLLSGRRIEDILIIDNRVCSYGFDFENGIPIKDFMGDKNDRELLYLTSYIRKNFIQNCPDVREVIKRDFIDPYKLAEKKRQYGIK